MRKMNGFDDCIAGVVERINQPNILCYDLDKVLKKLVNEHGMTEEEALEYWSYNQLGAWVGDTTPCFLRPAIEEDFEDDE